VGSSVRYTIVRDDWGAVCAGLWFAGLQACLLPPPLPPSPPPLAPSPPPAPARPPVTAAPQQPIHSDDPKSCIDAPSSADNAAYEAAEAAEPAVEDELQRRIERRWPQTRACLGGTPVTEPVHLEIEIGPDGNSRARVIETQLTDCKVIACIRDRLSGLQIAPPKAGRSLIYGQELNLDARATRGFRPESSWDYSDELEQRLACLDRHGSRLRPEVIRRTARASYDKLQTCYEDGLARNRELQGRVIVRFIIGREGKVASISVADNQLTDCAVVRCVRDTFRGIEFPAPKGGVVSVSYPIMLLPAEAPVSAVPRPPAAKTPPAAQGAR
jgi:hypothetical protein